MDFILLQSSQVGAGLMFFLAIILLLAISTIPGINIGFRLVGLPPLKSKYKKILKGQFDYYVRLSEKHQKQFEGRIQQFINIKEFIPRQMNAVTDEMKVLIAASAIQLTFGLPHVYLRHFNRILIYPDNYYSTINKVYHKGEVNPLVKIIVLSWTNFQHGYLEDDGINLGLHEMAHALHLENYIFNEEFRFFEASDLSKWKKYAHNEIKRMRSGEPSMFRKYAAISEEEFFAVVIENFFERSEEFFQNCKELYLCTAKLLNQNPLELLTHDK